MATRVRGPGARPGAQPKGPPLSKLESALLKAGVAKTPAEARALAKKLLAALKGMGLKIPSKGDLPAQLKEGLKEFQASQGLPASGELDADTRSALTELGVLPRPAAQQQDDAGELKLGDFGLAKPGDVFGERAGSARKATAKLGLEGPAGRMEPGADRAGRPGEKGHRIETRQLVERNKITEATKHENLQSLMNELAQAGFPGVGKGKAQLESALSSFQAAHGLPETGLADATTLATLANAGEAQTGESIEDDPEGRSSGQGNTAAGDDVLDDERGHAQHKEGEHDEGYYEIPPLSQQITSALEEIQRDEGKSGPQTYSWDVTFYRPGVYGRRQPAEPLWHLVVSEASPFDAVWDEARDKLSERLAQLEPDAAPPSANDFTLALRRARFRE